MPDQIEYAKVIRNDRGEIIHAFLTSDQKWRMQTRLHEISPLLRKTIIRKEDRLFYYHLGVNPLAIIRASFYNLFNMKRTSGASTITMQVARALERKPRTYGNKIIEIFRAWQLELKYNKNEILQLYCNLLPYGGNIEGIKAASHLYFSKDPDHLSLAEITALSIIPNRPTSLVPGRNNQRIRLERDRWLRRFAREGIYTHDEIQDALDEPFKAIRGQYPRQSPQLSRKLKNNAANEINTYINSNIQANAEKIVSSYVRAVKLRNITNAAVVVIDNKTHRVVTYVGSADFSDTLAAGQVDGVVAIRQPGSTLKPLLYALCFDRGLLTPKTIIADVQVNYQGYAPENFNKKFNGQVTTDYALEHSLNVPAVRSLRRLGTDAFLTALAGTDFRQIKQDAGKLGLSVVLGGCGSNLIELTALYAAFANGGQYYPPIFCSEQLIGSGRRIISPAAAFMVTESLSRINRPDFPLNWQSTEHMPKIAWKTGSSYGRRDGWSIGYNKHYTVGVWAGNFSGEGAADLTGSEIATPLLFRIFNTISYDADEAWYEQPGDCDLRMVCPETGLPTGEHCREAVTDYFIPAVSSTEKCEHLKEEFVSADGRISYCRACLPATGYRKKLVRNISPEMRQWMEENGTAYEKLPPHNPDCTEIFAGNKPVITSPQNGAEFLLSTEDPQPILLRCRASGDVSRVHWYIDNRFYSSADVHANVYFEPSFGPVKISCTDDKGRNRDIWINVQKGEW